MGHSLNCGGDFSVSSRLDLPPIWPIHLAFHIVVISVRACDVQSSSLIFSNLVAGFQ